MASDDQSGIMWLLGCLIALTLTGVFFSILVDKRFTFQRQTNTFQQKLEIGRKEARDLGEKVRHAEKILTASTSAKDAQVKALDAYRDAILSNSEEIENLESRKNSLTSRLEALGKDFALYRENYRKSVWRDAAGEKIDHIFLKNGRQFDRVVITRVTRAGLEISHAHGTARIDFEDLGKAYRDRFQWDESERDQVFANERMNRSAIQKKQAATKDKIKVPLISTTDQKSEAITKARNGVLASRSMVSTFSLLYSEAAFNSRSSAKRSVPGSLRTWAEQTSILQKKLAAAESKLALEVEQLRQVSPGDPLLQITE